jgi:hypothetical protein
VRVTQLNVGDEYARWREGSMDAPERLVLLELHGKGWVTVRRDDGEQERIRTTDLAGPFPGLAVQLLEAGQESRTLDAGLSIEGEPLRAGMVEQLLIAGCVEQTPSGLVITERGRSVLADHHADASCWPWPTRPWNRSRRRCACDRR